MESYGEQLKQRTKVFAVKIIRLFRTLPRTEEARVLGRQLLRSATSVAANYRAARRARSRAEFIAKMGLVVEEADETVLWIELLRDSEVLDGSTLKYYEQESNELLAIFAASYHTAKLTRKRSTA
ncbi:MAG: four helix bundle protein [Bacteroidota bacterium]